MMAGLEFHDVWKSFGAVAALRGVSFAVADGETHAIVGENGAGKSTLLKILAGILRPDAGTIRWRGDTLDLANPREALERGIGMVYQEMLAFPTLTVAANIFAGRELTRHGRLLEREMRRRTEALLDDLHLAVRPGALAEDLPAAHRQLLQVARALAFDCRVLVLDEPTTSLTDAETQHLFTVLDRLRARGVTLLYVSHRMPEVFRIADRITVLRDGAYVGTWTAADVSPDRIVHAMVGRDLPSRAAAVGADDTAPVVLEVRSLTRAPLVRDVSFALRAGEIVGLFGLVGSGRSELLETLVGLHAPQSGEIRIDGRAVRIGSVVDAVRHGMALVPEERGRQGLFFNLSLRHNLVLTSRAARGGALVRAAAERDEAARLLREWRIKAPGIDAPPDALSGGNQQKVVLARWLATGPRVLLLDEPTKGVDVGAKFDIHEIIRRQAQAGMACVVVSSDLPELLGLARRVLVMRDGRLRGEVAGAEATEAGVMALAATDLRDAS